MPHSGAMRPIPQRFAEQIKPDFAKNRGISAAYFAASEEGRFLETAQFAAVDALDRHLAQPLHRADADLQMAATCVL